MASLISHYISPKLIVVKIFCIKLHDPNLRQKYFSWILRRTFCFFFLGWGNESHWITVFLYIKCLKSRLDNIFAYGQYHFILSCIFCQRNGLEDQFKLFQDSDSIIIQEVSAKTLLFQEGTGQAKVNESAFLPLSSQ